MLQERLARIQRAFARGVLGRGRPRVGSRRRDRMPRRGAGSGASARGALATRSHPRTGLSRRSAARPQRGRARLVLAVVLVVLLLGLACGLNWAVQPERGLLPIGPGVGTSSEAQDRTPAPSTRVPPASAAPSRPTSGTSRTYVVQPGDTLATIALEHGTTIEALAQANKLDDPSRLSIGQRLSIPP